jgi:hypothetical protein
MRFKALIIAAVAAMSVSPAMAAGYGEFSGDWRNEDASTSSITRVRVTAAGGGLNVRVWGQCSPSDCDWGSEQAVAYSPSPGQNPATRATDLTVTFNPGFAQTILHLRDLPGDRLQYTIFTRFTDGSGRNPYTTSGTLRKHFGGWPGWPPGGFPLPPGGGPGGGGWPPGGGGGWPPGGGGSGGLSFTEDCINFNWAQVQASFVGGEWKVVQGSMWMLSFGPRMMEAQRAANIIRSYRFTQQCFIGRPNAAMTYWKRGTSVPSNGMSGEDCTTNNPATTQARRIGGRWKVVDGSHWLLDTGSNEADARRAEEVIRHYRLNRQCFVGRPNPSMSYWLAQ